MNFGDRIKALREEQGISREDLSNKINISYSALSKYETNNRFPDKETLNEIANYFNVSVDYLLGRTSIRNAINISEYNEEVLEVFENYKGLSEDNKQIIIQLIKKLNNDN